MNKLQRMLLLLIINCLFVFGSMAQGSKNDSLLAFSYFINNGKDGLHMAYSADGYSWLALKNGRSYLTPILSKDSLMRDPCIIRGSDGIFHMVWTVSWKERGIGYANSKDLVNWSKQQYLPVMEHEPLATNAWAPEITFIPEQNEYMIYWATTIPGKFRVSENSGDHNHRIYYVTTKNFVDYGETKLLYDQDFNVIDATIQKVNGRYVMILKDETLKPSPQKNLRIAFTDHATGGYSKPSLPITGNYWAEGPTAIKLKDEWVVYFDKYRDGKYGAVSTKDFVKWTDISAKINMPEGIRHGTVFKISAAELAVLKAVQ
ncbi:MAG: glycoside hydrolase family 43 protein [Bacteroidota bacterium]